MLNYDVPACKSGQLELEEISKFENKNLGIFHAFRKSVFMGRAIFLLSYWNLFGFVSQDKH
jgi:hypothetical protein